MTWPVHSVNSYQSANNALTLFYGNHSSITEKLIRYRSGVQAHQIAYQPLRQQCDKVCKQIEFLSTQFLTLEEKVFAYISRIRVLNNKIQDYNFIIKEETSSNSTIADFCLSLIDLSSDIKSSIEDTQKYLTNIKKEQKIAQRSLILLKHEVSSCKDDCSKYREKEKEAYENISAKKEKLKKNDHSNARKALGTVNVIAGVSVIGLGIFSGGIGLAGAAAYGAIGGTNIGLGAANLENGIKEKEYVNKRKKELNKSLNLIAQDQRYIQTIDDKYCYSFEDINVKCSIFLSKVGQAFEEHKAFLDSMMKQIETSEKRFQNPDPKSPLNRTKDKILKVTWKIFMTNWDKTVGSLFERNEIIEIQDSDEKGIFNQ
ncbi:MAG: hypothetical protein AAF443_01060 [Chlamydiota bacterium]